LTGSPVRIPKQTAAGTVYWVGENSTITASAATFGEVQMTPKIMVMRTQFSNLMNILSNPAIEGLIRNDFARTAALELDRVALRGLGASNEPLGVNGVTDLNTYALGTHGGDLTRQDALKIVGKVEDDNALEGKLAFITNPKVKRVLKNERIAQYSGQTTGAYTIYPLDDKQLNEMLGYPMFTTTQLPATLTKGSSSDCAEVFFGNWENLLLGMWGNMEILATNIGGNAWTQAATEVRLVQNVDVQVRHGESFALCNDARTNNA
jgi:HK97 family phage major capsid protein